MKRLSAMMTKRIYNPISQQILCVYRLWRYKEGDDDDV